MPSPILSRPRWQTFKLLGFLLTQFAKISSGPIKMLYRCDLQMLLSIAVRETERMAASYVTGLVARNSEVPGPAGIREQNPILGVNYQSAPEAHESPKYKFIRLVLLCYF